MAQELLVDINRKAFERIRTCQELFRITLGDLQGPILTRLAQKHRRQEARIFATQGRGGARGEWTPLSPAYAERKRRLVGLKKILVFSDDMKQRFILPSRPEYIERFRASSGGRIPKGGTYQFGARSEIAQQHFLGVNEMRRSKPGRGRNRKRKKRTKPFKPVSFRWVLPRRDMVTKTQGQIAELVQELTDWYRNERVPQVIRTCSKELRKLKGAA